MPSLITDPTQPAYVAGGGYPKTKIEKEEFVSETLGTAEAVEGSQEFFGGLFTSEDARKKEVSDAYGELKVKYPQGSFINMDHIDPNEFSSAAELKSRVTTFGIMVDAGMVQLPSYDPKKKQHNKSLTHVMGADGKIIAMETGFWDTISPMKTEIAGAVTTGLATAYTKHPVLSYFVGTSGTIAGRGVDLVNNVNTLGKDLEKDYPGYLAKAVSLAGAEDAVATGMLAMFFKTIGTTYTVGKSTLRSIGNLLLSNDLDGAYNSLPEMVGIPLEEMHKNAEDYINMFPNAEEVLRDKNSKAYKQKFITANVMKKDEFQGLMNAVLMDPTAVGRVAKITKQRREQLFNNVKINFGKGQNILASVQEVHKEAKYLWGLSDGLLEKHFENVKVDTTAINTSINTAINNFDVDPELKLLLTDKAEKTLNVLKDIMATGVDSVQGVNTLRKTYNQLLRDAGIYKDGNNPKIVNNVLKVKDDIDAYINNQIDTNPKMTDLERTSMKDIIRMQRSLYSETKGLLNDELYKTIDKKGKQSDAILDSMINWGTADADTLERTLGMFGADKRSNIEAALLNRLFERSAGKKGSALDMRSINKTLQDLEPHLRSDRSRDTVDIFNQMFSVLENDDYLAGMTTGFVLKGTPQTLTTDPKVHAQYATFRKLVEKAQVILPAIAKLVIKTLDVPTLGLASKAAEKGGLIKGLEHSAKEISIIRNIRDDLMNTGDIKEFMASAKDLPGVKPSFSASIDDFIKHYTNITENSHKFIDIKNDIIKSKHQAQAEEVNKRLGQYPDEFIEAEVVPPAQIESKTGFKYKEERTNALKNVDQIKALPETPSRLTTKQKDHFLRIQNNVLKSKAASDEAFNALVNKTDYTDWLKNIAFTQRKQVAKNVKDNIIVSTDGQTDLTKRANDAYSVFMRSLQGNISTQDAKAAWDTFGESMREIQSLSTQVKSSSMVADLAKNLGITDSAKVNKYLNSSRLQGLMKPIDKKLVPGAYEDNVNIIQQAIEREADVIAKRIEKDHGVKLDPRDVDKIVHQKYIEMIEGCK